ncbi:MAG: hypothetical protein ND866_18870 [Pyrinomonadaceae bacterium]|nr:hypothetical protein [Pyrinomonadaceae bacterium]
MKQRVLELVWINAVFLTMSLSTCAHSQLGLRSKWKLAYFDSSALYSASSNAMPIVKAKTPDTTDGKWGAIFVFRTDEFWLNLHHFLYVLGRAENKERDTSREAVASAPGDQERGFEKLSAKEQTIWRGAVSSYAAGPSKKDLVFDDPLPALTDALARADDLRSLTGSKVDPGIAAILQRAAPLYRKAWWKKHREANRNWQKAIQSLVDRHGATVLAFVTNAYMLQWPATGFPVHVSAYSNWAGAYSTTGDLLVVSSQSPGLQATYGLETVFHEGMHQWDGQVSEALREQARKVNKVAPRGLSHALICFTAGEAVRRVVPGHVPYAEEFGVWQRGLGPMKVALEEFWKPYLDGHGTRDEAFAKLIKRTAIDPAQK